jgi:RNA polymerase sigma-B factor
MHATSLDRPAQAEDNDGATMLDTIGSRDAELRRAFDRVALEALLDTLDERERTIVELYYQRELTQSEIGQRLGYSQMHISRLLRRATSRLSATAQHPGDFRPTA